MSTTDGPDAAAARDSLRLGMIAVFGAGFFYSFSPIFVRISEIGPGATGFWRLLLAIPLIWAATRVLERGKPAALPRLNVREVGFILFAGISFGLSIVVWQIGLHDTSVANSIFLANLHPIFVTLGAWLAFREHLTVLFLLGLAMTVIGTALLAGVGVTDVAPLTIFQSTVPSPSRCDCFAVSNSSARTRTASHCSAFELGVFEHFDDVSALSALHTAHPGTFSITLILWSSAFELRAIPF